MFFIYLDTFKSDYFFVESFDIIDFKLDNKQHSIFVCKDLQNDQIFETNYKWEDYDLNIDKNKVVIKNTIFWTEVFSEEIKLNNKIFSTEGFKPSKKSIIQDNKYLSIAGFFIFNDLFIKNSDDNFNKFYLFLQRLYFDNWTKINITKYDDLFYPKIKINLLVNSDSYEFEDFRKMLLSFFPENMACYLIDNERVEDYFSSSSFNDFTHLEINKVETNYKNPDNIYSFDKKISDFKLNLMKLRYNLYLLKEVCEDKQKINLDNKYNQNIKLLKNRLDIEHLSLTVVIEKYEEKFKHLLSLINE